MVFQLRQCTSGTNRLPRNRPPFPVSTCVGLWGGVWVFQVLGRAHDRLCEYVAWFDLPVVGVHSFYGGLVRRAKTNSGNCLLFAVALARRKLLVGLSFYPQHSVRPAGADAVRTDSGGRMNRRGVHTEGGGLSVHGLNNGRQLLRL